MAWTSTQIRCQPTPQRPRTDCRCFSIIRSAAPLYCSIVQCIPTAEFLRFITAISKLGPLQSMASQSQPSPLLLGPPLRPLMSRVGPAYPGPGTQEPRIYLPPLRQIDQPIQQATLSHVPNVTASCVRSVAILSEFLKIRPNDAAQSKVVAVDGDDKNAVHLTIATLHFHITKDLGRVVRVFGEETPEIFADQRPEFAHFITRVQTWGAMWEAIRSGDAPVASSYRPAGAHQPAPPPGGSCVYILPLSPLTATIQAANRGTDYFRWLASYWSAHVRPDVTINIQNPEGAISDRQIVKVFGDLRALIVTKGAPGGIDLSPKQLRRVVFEVEEWIRDE